MRWEITCICEIFGVYELYANDLNAKKGFETDFDRGFDLT